MSHPSSGRNETSDARWLNVGRTKSGAVQLNAWSGTTSPTQAGIEGDTSFGSLFGAQPMQHSTVPQQTPTSFLPQNPDRKNSFTLRNDGHSSLGLRSSPKQNAERRLEQYGRQRANSRAESPEQSIFCCDDTYNASNESKNTVCVVPHANSSESFVPVKRSSVNFPLTAQTGQSEFDAMEKRASDRASWDWLQQDRDEAGKTPNQNIGMLCIFFILRVCF